MGKPIAENVFPRCDIIFICAPCGVETGVRLGVHQRNALNVDVERQNAVQFVEKISVGVQILHFRIEMRHIVAGVNASVGAACAGNLGVGFEQR